jgi:hypothetical protein
MRMGNSGRGSGSCVVGNTKLIVRESENPLKLSEIEITSLKVVFDVEIDFKKPSDQQVQLVLRNKPGDVPPIKALKMLPGGEIGEEYVIPTFRFKYLARSSLPLVKICVKMVPDRGLFEFEPCNPRSENAKSGNPDHHVLTTTFSHPLTEKGTFLSPAYVFEETDKVIVDPPTGYRREGMILCMTQVTSQDVYGLRVTNLDNARRIFNQRDTTQTRLNASLQDYLSLDTNSWLKDNELMLTGKVTDFVLNRLANFTDEILPGPPITLNGLTLQEHIIITNKIASGSKDIEERIHTKIKKGFTDIDFWL